MQAEAVLTEREEPYLDKFKSKFYGMLFWHELDTLWKTMENQSEDDWYIYDLNEEPPTSTVDKSELLVFIRNIDEWLRDIHQEKYCGAVYTDNKESPCYIKIFHPKKMGFGTCSLIKEAPLPGWIISTLKPTKLKVDAPINKSWWNKLLLISNKI